MRKNAENGNGRGRTLLKTWETKPPMDRTDDWCPFGADKIGIAKMWKYMKILLQTETVFDIIIGNV
jgi:hypothetical protein